MTRFLQAYLTAYVYWLLISLGCLGIAMMRTLTGGRWGKAIAPALAAGIRTLPAMALLFLPIAVGLGRIFPWAPAEHRWFYLNVPFFLGRAALYFIVWLWLAWKALPAAGDDPAGPGGFGLVLWSFAVTFASVDWMLSTDPQAHSTIFGLIVIAGAGLSAYAACTLTICWPLRERELTGPERDVLNDLGNLMLAFLMLWAYTEFSQWLIIWSGDLPNEISWYLARARRGWEIPGYFVIAFGFFAPFFALLFRDVKRRAAALATLAACVLAVRWLDLYWTIMPSFFPQAPSPDWRDLLAFVSVGAVWSASYLRAAGPAIRSREKTS